MMLNKIIHLMIACTVNGDMNNLGVELVSNAD